VILSSSYSEWKYDRKALRERVAAIHEAIADPLLVKLTQPFDAIVLTGSSGTWLGSMLACTLDVPVVLCRKDGERSHGPVFESRDTTRVKRLLLVDDFVATGDTVRRVCTQWTDYAALRAGSDEDEYAIVGVLQHGHLLQRGNLYGEGETPGGLYVERHIDERVPCVARRNC
jgi:hypothetical protein